MLIRVYILLYSSYFILKQNLRVNLYRFNMMFTLLRLVLGCSRWLVDYNSFCLIKSFSYNQHLFFQAICTEIVPKSFYRILPYGSTRLAIATRINWEETKNFLTLTLNSTFNIFSVLNHKSLNITMVYYSQ